MQYKRINTWTNENDMLVSEFKLPKDVFFNHFHGESLINYKFPKLIFEQTENQKNDLYKFESFPIISDSFKQVLEQFNNDLKHIELIQLNSNVAEKYYFLNILNTIPCFDWENSEYTKYPDFIPDLKDTPDSITNLKVKEGIIDGRNIFRMREKPIHIFISEILENAILSAKLKGIKIVNTMDLRQSYD